LDTSSKSDRLDGIEAIAQYMGISRKTFYNRHFRPMQNFLLQRDNHKKTKNRAKWYTFKDMVKMYLIEVEIERDQKNATS